MSFLPKRPRRRRRGVTLLEMLVAVALLVLMMTIVVQVFAAATGAVSAAKTYQDLDSGLRQLDSVIRQDLKNISATLTPPLNPADNKGYFEYGENSFADLQGEDTDDYLRFTVWAPEGQFFTGRMYINPPATVVTAINAGASPNYLLSSQPITVTSQCAEIIYFLRNGNLYRRVLLVAPERQSAISQFPPNIVATKNSSYYVSSAFQSGGIPLALSWQGVNDLSARPAANNAASGNPITLNTLGDLTNRENRFAYSRFCDDYVTNPSVVTPPDGIPDDENTDAAANIIGDGIHDYYPSLYAGVFNPSNGRLIFEMSNGNVAIVPRAAGVSAETMAFPYVFPGAYSKPDLSTTGAGWIHSPNPKLDQTTLLGLNGLNHNPIDVGDSLSVPGPPIAANESSYQTWWGFPTWRETLSYNWPDPCYPLNGFTLFSGAEVGVTPPSQPFYLHPYLPGSASATARPQFTVNVGYSMLPPMSGVFQAVPPLFSDNVFYQAGDYTLANPPVTNVNAPGALWQTSWEDDLIMSGVRSFDVKAYDNSFPGYVDLGWGDDLRITTGSLTTNPVVAAPFFLAQTPGALTWNGFTYGTLAQTFAHEGRIPPLVNDLRFDNVYGVSNGQYITLPVNTNTYNGNIGDNNNVVRLRRVWDTWSTDYAVAPSTGYDPSTFGPIGPPYSPPVYPSYPPPYPMPLRGIQIQIRVVDPSNQRIKVLTIRQDFSDKLQ